MFTHSAGSHEHGIGPNACHGSSLPSVRGLGSTACSWPSWAFQSGSSCFAVPCLPHTTTRKALSSLFCVQSWGYWLPAPRAVPTAAAPAATFIHSCYSSHCKPSVAKSRHQTSARLCCTHQLSDPTEKGHLAQLLCQPLQTDPRHTPLLMDNNAFHPTGSLCCERGRAVKCHAWQSIGGKATNPRLTTSEPLRSQVCKSWTGTKAVQSAQTLPGPACRP